MSLEMTNLSDTDKANADEIAGYTHEPVEQVVAEAAEYAAKDGESVSEELAEGAAMVELTEMLGGAFDDDADDDADDDEDC